MENDRNPPDNNKVEQSSTGASETKTELIEQSDPAAKETKSPEGVPVKLNEDEEKRLPLQEPPQPSKQSSVLRKRESVQVPLVASSSLSNISQRRRRTSVRLSVDIKRSSFRRSSSLRKSKTLTSKAKLVLGSILDIKATALGFDRKTPKYQNTYRLQSDNSFNPEKVEKILQEIMEEAMENLRYDPETCSAQAKWASAQIRARVKQLEFDRYKLICIVSIGEKNSQDVYVTCKFLWDAQKDRFATYTMENTYVYGIAYCFGLYYE